MKEIISSNRNYKIKYLKKLYNSRKRKKEGKFVLEGYRLIEEAINLGAGIESIFMSPGFAESGQGREIQGVVSDTLIELVDENILIELADTVTPQGIIAVVNEPRYDRKSFLKESERILVLDRVQDPGNMGTLIRTALAAGFDGIIALKGSVDIFNLKVLRATAGAVFNIPIYSNIDLKGFIEIIHNNKRYRIITTDPRGELYYHQLEYNYPLMVVVGNEAHGIRDEIYDHSHYRVKIPIIKEIDSLNAAIAGALVMYQVVLKQELY